MTETSIRGGQPGDLSALQDIARRTIDRCYRPFLGDDSVDWYIDNGESDMELEKHLNGCDVLLQDGTIVAFGICIGDLIPLMMVDVDRHREGLGSQLLAHCEHRLFACGLDVIRLETFKGNGQAISFYLKNGWAIRGTKQDEDFGFVRVLLEKNAA